MSFKIALCQTPVTSDKAENLTTASKYLHLAKKGGADLAVLPECFNSPYSTLSFADFAEHLPSPSTPPTPHNSPTLSMLQKAAVETDMYIIGGSIPEITPSGQIFNTSLSISPAGTLLAKHRKAHLFDIDVPNGIRFKESDVLTPGDHPTVFEAEQLGVRIGLSICYDVRFPELAMIQTRELGAKILVFPAAFNLTTGPAHWELLLRARAVDNQVFVAACSPARGEGGYQAWGHSMVIDPWGRVLATCEEEEGVVFTDVDLKVLDSVRESVPVLKQRREDIYKVSRVEK